MNKISYSNEWLLKKNLNGLYIWRRLLFSKWLEDSCLLQSFTPLSRMAACRTHQWAFSLTERDNLHLMADEPVMNQVKSSLCAASPFAGASFFIFGQQKAHKHQSALSDNTQRFALAAWFNKVVSQHLPSSFSNAIFVSFCGYFSICSDIFPCMLIPSSLPVSHLLSPPTSWRLKRFNFHFPPLSLCLCLDSSLQIPQIPICV